MAFDTAISHRGKNSFKKAPVIITLKNVIKNLTFECDRYDRLNKNLAKAGENQWIKKWDKLDSEALKLINLNLNWQYWSTARKSPAEHELVSEEMVGKQSVVADQIYSRFETLRGSIKAEAAKCYALMIRLSMLPKRRKQQEEERTILEERLSSNAEKVNSIKQELGLGNNDDKVIDLIVNQVQTGTGSKNKYVKTNLE